jgi:outer membrane receptor protein involved in Fe transport
MPRSMCRLLFVVGVVAVPVVVGAGAAQAQSVEDGSRGPRFLLASATSPSRTVPIDLGRAPVLRRRIALELDRVTLKQALAAIARAAGLDLAYTEDVVPLGNRVQLRADGITVAAALTDVLVDANVDVVFTPDGRAVLKKRVGAAPLQTGAIAGRVTAKAGGGALVGATVVLEGTRLSATTRSDGRYRIGELVPGTYTVRARYIGYAPGSASAAVSADQEATADFALEKSAQQLSEVVTTGTVVPTEVKALPTPVSIISASDIALQRPRTVAEMLRQVVPSAVSWDFPSTPYQTSLSVRGTSSIGGGLDGQLKVFIDGVEAALNVFSAIDPSSIERMEVIRGPQAAAIYGSDALGGVLAIFTKRGNAALARPEVDAQAAIGTIQTPYGDNSGALRQSYSASVGGAGPDATYHFGAGYSHTGDWLPAPQQSAQSSVSLSGGMHFARGIVSADLWGRYYVLNNPQVFDPTLIPTGDPYYATPFHQPVRNENQTIGVRLGVAATPWWQHTVTVGLDRLTQDQTQTQPRLTTPADTLLSILNFYTVKYSIGYNTSLQGSLAAGLSGSLTAGFDHYSLPLRFWTTGGAVTTTGSIQTDPTQPVTVFVSETNNTGYFAQAQLGFRDMLFLTAGIRGEQNTNFGDSLGTPLTPRVGLSYVRPLGSILLKLRGSWGRSIRPPSSGAKAPSSQAGYIQLANPTLAPERQHGWDAGVDAVFGARGSFNLTYYDQTADNLIQAVLIQDITYQNQNVGRIRNTGIEVEGTLNTGSLQVKAQYAYTRSRIARLNAGYTGDLAVGDQSLLTPKHTAGASLTLTPMRGTTVAGGLTYVGGWTAYDGIAQSRCSGGTGPCLPTLRDYQAAFAGFVKVNASVFQRLTPFVSGFVSVDNLTNNEQSEVQSGFLAMGRITTMGLRFHY